MNFERSITAKLDAWRKINYITLLTGMLVNRATKALEVKHKTQTTASPATCEQVSFTKHNKTTLMEEKTGKLLHSEI